MRRARDATLLQRLLQEHFANGIPGLLGNGVKAEPPVRAAAR